MHSYEGHRGTFPYPPILTRIQGRRMLIDTLQTLLSTEARMVANPHAGVVVSGGSFSTWAVAITSPLPSALPPGAPPPDAAEEIARLAGGRGAAKSARRSQIGAAGAVRAAEVAEVAEATELRDGVTLIAALCACWQAHALCA